MSRFPVQAKLLGSGLEENVTRTTLNLGDRSGLVQAQRASPLQWVTALPARLGLVQWHPRVCPHPAVCIRDFHPCDKKAEHQQRNLPWAFYLQHLPQDLGGHSQLLPRHTTPMHIGKLFPTPGRLHKETFSSHLQAAPRPLWTHGWTQKEEHLENPEGGSVLLAPAEETPPGMLGWVLCVSPMLSPCLAPATLLQTSPREQHRGCAPGLSAVR